MDEICRLCCSTKFVNNDIFDEENALYLKLSLYLPIKVFKNDRLPQKVCDKCSCKVNDFYQFCNETIEVQNRLRSLFLLPGTCIGNSVDLTLVKDSCSPPPVHAVHCERSTQTDSPDAPYDCNVLVQVKEEPKPIPSIKKEEDSYYNIESDHFDNASSGSDDISLITLKKKKGKKSVNGSVTEKKARKKKAIKEWGDLINSLPDATITVVDEAGVALDGIKEELLDEKPPQLKDIDLFNCCICFTQCFSRTEALQHYRQHAAEFTTSEPPAAPPPPDQEPLRCTRCRKVVTRGEWAAHWTRHWERDRRPYRCALCEKTFRDPHQILKHGLTHKYEAGAAAEPVNKRFVCDLCPEAFVYMRYLLSHRTRAHPEAAGRALALRCGVCARHFAHINSLRRHLRAHSGERNFLCNVCGKALSSREHLKFHIRIHTGYKPNVCKTCGKGFVKKCNLTLHERVHSGEKPHVCSHCGKAFSQRSTLVIHERSLTRLLRREAARVLALRQGVQSEIHAGHTRAVRDVTSRYIAHSLVYCGEKPHVCSHCGKAFSQRSTLVIHERSLTRLLRREAARVLALRQGVQSEIHAGHTRAVRDVTSRYIAHSLVYCGEKPHVCSHCGKAFSQRSTLVIHERSLTRLLRREAARVLALRQGVQSEIHAGHTRAVRDVTSRYIAHSLVYCGEKPHVCSHCGKAFSQRSTLVIHERSLTRLLRREAARVLALRQGVQSEIHAGHTRAVRDVTSRYIAHSLVYCGEKPHVCSHCGKAFSQRSTLVIHERSLTRLLRREAARVLALRQGVQSEIHAGHTRAVRDVTSRYIAHSLVYCGEKPHVCSHCGKAFSQRSTLVIHERSLTRLLRREAARVLALRQGVQSEIHAGHTREVRDVTSRYIAHSLVYCGEKPHVCSHCGKAFSQRSTLVIHESSLTRLLRREAARVLALRQGVQSEIHAGHTRAVRDVTSRYIAHSLVYCGEKPHVCSHCGKAFSQRSTLVIHERSLTRLLRREAARVLALRQGVQSEIHAGHTRAVRDVTSRYIAHSLVYCGEKPHVCSHCGKAFSQRSTLVIHERSLTRLLRREAARVLALRQGVQSEIHAGHTRAVRDVTSRYIAHSLVYCGEKPHVCSHCGKAFSQRSTLVIHERSLTRLLRREAARVLALRQGVQSEIHAGHTRAVRDVTSRYIAHSLVYCGEKPHVCSHCGKAFSQRSTLVIHERSLTRLLRREAARVLALRQGVQSEIHAGHTRAVRDVTSRYIAHSLVYCGEKPHVCSHCGKAFSQRSTLVIHERSLTRLLRREAARVLALRQGVQSEIHAGHTRAVRDVTSRYIAHSLVYCGEKPHVCSHCGKAFSQRSTLVIHESSLTRLLRREAARVLALRQGVQSEIHTGHTREVPQRRAAVRVRAVRARLRGQGAAVHASQDHLHIAPTHLGPRTRRMQID
ncbi:hypothetical protein PYW07_011235 [Mythimna separata]|uniref:Uncharacterized protein n=1 Tax=Mythimna separata TaxID=271217 RepID=A0AAD7Y7M9_MYTSE|nr:hypothetical protein PYW07_011235 [Mythimna separata]